MGTSSSYGGPTGINPLLPDWAQPDMSSPAQDDGAPDGDASEAGNGDTTKDMSDGQPASAPSTDTLPQLPATTNFRGAKSSMTRFVSGGGGGGGRGRIARVGRNYVRARGGSRGSAQAATSGRSSTARLGSFLSSVASQGVAEAARTLGLGDLAGRSAADVFAAIANSLAPSGATLEEAAARRAVDDALFALYRQFDLENADISRLDQMDGQAIRGAVEASVSAYIYHRWLQELGDRIEENAVTADQAVRLEREVRDYVEQTVRLDLREIDVLTLDWNGPEGSRIVERIYQEAYGLLE